ncbi:tyrosine-protein phosphatase 10D-like [Spodoptera litura]|uniref:protein-tyrosine-phosphatase n=1 Tax=Spodoptera litura TaxID=69820 RepID=A0A9J7IW54_SPOLT|nr:tyrosine-protein phosphatase 10D-like [Spodoptera litura]
MDNLRKKNSVKLKRKCREIGQSSPSMMWKRSIVQATTGCARATAALAMLLTVFASTWRGGACADLVIEIPGSVGGEAEADGGRYRLDYRPPHGTPPPNFTVPARANTINFQGLPGTKYHFMLYYSNATFADLLTWNQTIITAPEPPTNLTVTLGRNKQAHISWSPPAHGDYTGFRFKVIPLTERAEGGANNITAEGAATNHTLRDLSPGATYQLHAFTLLHDKESAAYASRNFTTKPNTPGKFIVWFRNETTLLVLWQPPYPPGAYTHYKVSIVPPDARDSELYVEKEGEPPGPAQAAFKGLVPGRAYNISVQTVSEPEISAPTTAQYRTVPLRPRNVTVPLADLKETSFKVTWLPPLEESEFEKYQVSVSGTGGGGRRLAPVVRARNDTPACAFEGLEPGAPYTVTVKTMSGKVTSWPAATDLTLKPLPVRDLAWRYAADGAVDLWWAPAPASTQDEYKVSYHEAGPSRDDSNTLSTAEPRVTLRALLAGRNYSVWAPAGPRARAALDGLQPGRAYSVSIAAHSYNLSSDVFTMDTRTRPLIQSEMTIVNEPGTDDDNDTASTTLKVIYTRTPGSASQFDSYRFQLEGAGAEPRWSTRPADAEGQAVEFSGLVPGRLYNVTMWTVSHNVTSHPVQRQARLFPRPITQLNATEIGAREITLAWDKPVGDYTDFEVQYLTDVDQLQTLTTEELGIKVEALRPHSVYTFTVVVVAGRGGALRLTSRGRSADVRTRQAPPAPAAPAPAAARTSRPVRVADFIDHYRLMSADSDFRFSEEFEELKHVGREQPCSAADLPVNRPKNRFTNILPYDHSRYKLQPVDDEEGSDYINANYVPGHNSPREFIVTQGPLHCTRDDFWRMCWESGSRAIVMLTRCVEKGREKCDRYWPYDTRPVYYGDIAVTALNESRYPDWTVTELMLCRGAEQRVLKHFHFTTWPDFGVPDPPTTLARFVRAFRERCPADARPVVVHCSAGVGRSGTFITLDTALQQLAAHADCLDVFGMVHAMRRERVWMVQTEQQYICIHQCLVAVLEGQDLAAPPPHHHHNAAFEGTIPPPSSDD